MPGLDVLAARGKVTPDQTRPGEIEARIFLVLVLFFFLFLLLLLFFLIVVFILLFL